MVTCLDIELAILKEFNFRQNIIVPNISSMMGVVPFETDMLVISKSGYATGFEIKTSKSDLTADFKKPQHPQMNEVKNGKTGFERYWGRFKYFFYALPESLKDDALNLIPSFCGLYTLQDYDLRPKFTLVRDAELICNFKWDERRIFEVARLGTMRIHDLKQTLNQFIKNK
jgi:hypothetical protein